MARTTIVQLTDDIDGSEADQTVEFSYKGKSYSLDLNDKNASELDDVLAPYIAAAEKAGGAQSRAGGRSSRSGGSRRGPSASGGTANGPDSKDVRAWAETNGVQVSARGRIPASVIEQYKAANT
ncbi:MAG: Lsr2 family protein [Actinomycetota bacterium]|nr:Lsr2 family protein [Actinomycetota bacterium]